VKNPAAICGIVDALALFDFTLMCAKIWG